MKLGTCRAETCRAPILWALTINGRTQPFDPEPNPEGDFVLIRRLDSLSDGEHPLAVSHSRLGLGGDEILAAGAATYMPHHATCPARKEFADARDQG